MPLQAQRFGDMDAFDRTRSVEVRDSVRDLERAVMGARGKRTRFGGLGQQRGAWPVRRGDLVQRIEIERRIELRAARGLGCGSSRKRQWSKTIPGLSEIAPRLRLTGFRCVTNPSVCPFL